MPKKRARPTKADIKQLEKRLKYQPELVWDKLAAADRRAVMSAADDYKNFLDAAKTEREAVRTIVAKAEAAGFKNLMDGGPGNRRLSTMMDKVAALAVTGRRPLTEGLRLIISHIDAPRLDLKPRPLYEEVDLALLKTHYYGGLKKYQWLSRPLALHGRVIKDDGRAVDLVIGEDDHDPVFTVADLLPHLARQVQTEKKVSEAFPGEKMNLLIGSLPLGDSEVKERFKLAALDILDRRWGLREEDFLSAEFEAVPAGRARDVGLDRGLIGAYGQDDRICAYAALNALTAIKTPAYTCLALFVDKEEIGSEGATGAKSRFLETFVADLLEKTGQSSSSASLRQALMKTKAISGDVNGALDPDYQEVHEKMNAARLGYGPCLSKYTGSGGKYHSSEASAEYLGWLRGVFKRAKIVWQSGLLGRIDEGGGGTVAMFLAEHGMEIVDCGPALLAMHAPFEISSKADLYMTIKAYRAFFQAD